MIGESVFTLPGETFGKTDDCLNWKNHPKESVNWSYKNKSRYINGNTGVRPLENISSTTSYYKKNNGNWGLWFAKISTEIGGTPYMNASDNKCGEQWTKDSKKSTLPWGCYVYRARATGQNSWGIFDERKITSIHTAPGSGEGSGPAYYKWF